MTDAGRVSEIEARLAEATDAPWFVERELIMDATRERTIVIVGCGDDDPQVERDAALVACAPADLRWCLDRITEAHALLSDIAVALNWALVSGHYAPSVEDWLESVSTDQRPEPSGPVGTITCAND